MKLLIENFRQFIIKEEIEKFIDNKTELTEQELRAFIKDLCSQKGIYLTEEQLNEWVPSAMKRFGRRAGMLAALGGAGAPVAAAAPGQGQMKDKITMMKQSVKDKAGDVKQKMQDLGVKIDDAGEEDAAEDVSQEVGKIVDNGDGSFSMTEDYKIKNTGNWEGAKRVAGSRALTKLQAELGSDFVQSGALKVAAPDGNVPGATIYVTVTVAQ
jgi:hypothetical protein